MSETEPVRKFQKELNAGISGLLVLGLIVRSRRAMYGYEIGMELAGMSDDGLPMNAAALYPVLRSLERSGLLTSKVEPSVSAPPRRYYTATDAGRRVLSDWINAWERTRRIVDRVLEKHREKHPENKHAAHRQPARRRPKVS